MLSILFRFVLNILFQIGLLLFLLASFTVLMFALAWVLSVALHEYVYPWLAKHGLNLWRWAFKIPTPQALKTAPRPAAKPHTTTITFPEVKHKKDPMWIHLHPVHKKRWWPVDKRLADRGHL